MHEGATTMARWAVKLESVLKYSEHPGAGADFEHTEIGVVMHYECDTAEEAEQLAIQQVTIEAEAMPFQGDDEEWCGGDLDE